MENLIRAMMDLIASEVCGKTIDKSQYELTDEDLAKLYKLSKSHDLAHLVGDALNKCGGFEKIAAGADDAGRAAVMKVREKFDNQIFTAVYRYEKINYELGNLRSVLNGAGIDFIPLKGSVIRKYYPEPWMRTSCDIDILVHESEVDQIADLLVSELKYKKEEKSPHDISLYSGGGVHLELHYNLIEDGCIGDMESVLRSVWDRASAVDGTSEFTLSDEMFYYYHIAHMAKHFVSTGGCGIRPFVDIWVLNHRISFDRERRSALLSDGGLRTFAEEAEALSEAWFGDGEHTDVTQQMQNYVLCGGVYGTTENRVAVQQVKRGGKFRYAFSRIWLPYDTLKFHYPSLDGKRALLPFYEMRRWCKLIFCGGAKRGMNELRLNSEVSDTEMEKTKEMLERLGIDR